MNTIKRLLVTGSTGFVAAHVKNACAPGGAFAEWEFHGSPAGWDIRDVSSVRSLVEQVRPDGVLHLAAQSFVPRSFQAPQETFEVNLIGTANLLQALTATGFAGRMVFVSSGDVYGRVPDEALPVTEARLPEPRSPYAVSKIAAEQLCLQWHRTENLDVVIARPFNHVGPGQDSRFVLPALAHQVVAIAEGRQAPVIEAGDIDTTRDFTDVRDVVSAYAAMFARAGAGETYLIGSGQERRVRDLLLDMCRLASLNVAIQQDPAKLRPSEQRRMVASAQKLARDTGWSPQIPLETTLLDILNDARNHK
ncbi:MAG TPA: GDP-mannose 4,6-dehydratase [Lysobacter sp.]